MSQFDLNSAFKIIFSSILRNKNCDNYENSFLKFLIITYEQLFKIIFNNKDNIHFLLFLLSLFLSTYFNISTYYFACSGKIYPDNVVRGITREQFKVYVYIIYSSLHLISTGTKGWLPQLCIESSLVEYMLLPECVSSSDDNRSLLLYIERFPSRAYIYTTNEHRSHYEENHCNRLCIFRREKFNFMSLTYKIVF